MPRYQRPKCRHLLFLAALATFGLTSIAAAETMEEMQRRLNAEVMASEFDAGDIKKAEAYADEAQKRGEKPVTQAPSYWQPGWTCSHLTRYRYYNYYHYRNCIYHHRYYGYYW